MQGGNAEIAVGGAGLKVAAYYRMSSDEQNLSIGQQEAEVRKFCAARGWIIVIEYHDFGKSGSKDVEKRKAFHRLIADASKGKFRAVVCYDTSRFGRLDSMTGAPFKNELRKHGVYLETVKDGRLDWSTSMGRLTDALLSEKNHEYSLSLSNAVVRGRQSLFEAGFWSVGEIPFGYDRELVENGVTQMVLPRSKKFAKPRNWHTKLKVNETEAQIVKDIFKRFATSDISLRGLAKELHANKVAGPGLWTPQILNNVLRQAAYIGRASIGYKRKPKEVHNRIEQATKDNACPPILTDALFNKVQAKLETRKKDRGSTSQARSGSLSGILICGHCGYKMDKRERKGVVTYVCSSANRRQHLGCKQWVARESDIEQILCDELIKAVDAKALERLALPDMKEKKSEVAAMAAAVQKLEKQYDKARANLLLADADIFPMLQKDVLRLKAELDQQRNTLTLAQTDKGAEQASDLIAWLYSFKGQMRTVTAELPNQEGQIWKECGPIHTTAEKLRELFKSLHATLTVHWSQGGSRYHQLTTGVLRAEIVTDKREMAFSADKSGNVVSDISSKCRFTSIYSAIEMTAEFC